MRLFLLITLVALTGCSSMGGSSANDACKLLDRNAVQRVMGSELTRMELDPGIDNGRVSGSACMMDFADGVFVRLTVEEWDHLDAMRAHRDEIWTQNRSAADSEMTAALGFPAFFDRGREYFEADIAEGKYVYINMDQRAPAPTSSTSVEKNMVVTRFAHDKVDSARDKGQELIRLVQF